jgi:SAM-dependent methyltransferase
VLVRADGCALPFADRSFDAAVIVSALEFVPDPGTCLRECLRVLRDDGLLVCVSPRQLAWADRILQWLVGVRPEDEFRGGRARAQEAIEAVLPDAHRSSRPGWLPGWLAPYILVVRDGRHPGLPARRRHDRRADH